MTLQKRINQAETHIKKYKVLFFAMALTLGAIAFQNCAPEGFRVLESSPSPDSNTNPNTNRASVSAAVAVGILDSKSCGGGKVDACVYLKSPYYQKLVQPHTANSEVRPQFGVPLTGLDDSGYLKNTDFQIVAEFPVRKIDDRWMYFSTPQDGVAQLSAYYYAQHLIEFVRHKIPAFTLSNLKINIGSSSSGWAPSTNDIFLERSPSGADLAYDGSLVTYFTALAIIDKLSNGASQVASDDPNHTACGPSDSIVYENDCCRGSFCINALTSGMADYLVSVIFSEAPVLSSPTLGEYAINRTSGLGHCGLLRNLNEVYSLTQAYNACETAPAQIHNLGSVYGQIWWQARKALQPSELEEFDKFFLTHIEALSNKDNHITLLNEASQIDLNRFQGKFFKYLVTTIQNHNMSLRP